MAALRQQLHPGPTLERAQDLMDIVTSGGNVTLPAGELKGYVDEAEKILDAHGDKTSALRAQLLQARAQATAPDWSECARYARQAVDVARQLPPTYTFVEALFTYGRCEGVAGDPALALASAQEGLKVIDSTVKSEYHRPLLLATQAMMQLRLGLLADSIASARDAQQARDAQTGNKTSGSADLLSESLVAGARPKEALATMSPRVAWDLAHPERADRAMLARALDTRARVLIQLGDVDGAMRDLVLAQSTVADFEPGNWLDAYRWETVAAVRLAQGRLAQAQCSLDQARIWREKRHETQTVRMNYQTVLRVALALRGGQFDAAKAQLDSFITEPAGANGVSRTELERQLLQSEILLASNQWSQALLTSSAVLEKILHSSQAAYLLDLSAQAYSVQGQALLETGQNAQAQIALQNAVRAFTGLYDERLSLTLAHNLRALARADRALGKTDQAVRLIQKAKAMETEPRVAAPDKYFQCPVAVAPNQGGKT
jgi:tetratricopeptide (TPR) repeat protein